MCEHSLYEKWFHLPHHMTAIPTISGSPIPSAWDTYIHKICTHAPIGLSRKVTPDIHSYCSLYHVIIVMASVKSTAHKHFLHKHAEMEAAGNIHHRLVGSCNMLVTPWAHYHYITQYQPQGTGPKWPLGSGTVQMVHKVMGDEGFTAGTDSSWLKLCDKVYRSWVWARALVIFLLSSSFWAVDSTETITTLHTCSETLPAHMRMWATADSRHLIECDPGQTLQLKPLTDVATSFCTCGVKSWNSVCSSMKTS